MSVHAIRAFANDDYDYYRLMYDFGHLKAGAIFYLDPDDDVYGSPAGGCLKLCWTPDGDCYSMLCGGTVILHKSFIETEWFCKLEKRKKPVVSFAPDKYKVEITEDGTIEIYSID